jgi:alkylhydroperoxidase family enzyme
MALTKQPLKVTRVDEKDPALATIVADTFARVARGVVGVINIHRTLARSPDMFAGFIALAHALRNTTELPAPERELAILRVLERHQGEYEIGHHRRLGRTLGLGEAQLEGTAAREIDPSLYDERQLAALRFADAFSEKQGVDPELTKTLERLFGERQIVELSLTLALYVGLAHLTHAIDVPVDVRPRD